MRLPCYPGVSRRPGFAVVAALTLTASLFVVSYAIGVGTAEEKGESPTEAVQGTLTEVFRIQLKRTCPTGKTPPDAGRVHWPAV
jgi:hypothetical protein